MSLFQSTDDGDIWQITLRLFTETTGFILGFIVGGLSGYFGNWLWHRFGPKKNKPHYQLTSEDGQVSFSGVLDQQNSQQAIRSIQGAIEIHSDKSEDYSLPNEEVGNSTNQ